MNKLPFNLFNNSPGLIRGGRAFAYPGAAKVQAVAPTRSDEFARRQPRCLIIVGVANGEMMRAEPTGWIDGGVN